MESRDLRVTWRAPGELAPWAANSRTHGEEQIGALALAMPARGSRDGLRAADQRPTSEDGASPAPEPPPVAAYRKWVDVKQRRRRKAR